MIGIQDIGVYIPNNFISNYDRKSIFGFDDYFIEQKIGVKKVSVMSNDEETSDLCVKAWENLIEEKPINSDEIDCIVVVTQNPDSNIPHVSARVHGLLGFSEKCACFDISLGCSGFVYALSTIEAFLERNGFSSGLLFTADPYSKIINAEDKNTSILFGDGAAVTLITKNPVLIAGTYNFGTIGKQNHELTCNEGKLYMNGRAIFDFAARYVPRDINALVKKNKMTLDDIDLFLLHQGSKYIVDTITKRLKISKEKAPFLASEYGNTVSSTIPIMLSSYIGKQDIDNILISGFGVGLSWASTVLKRV